MNTINLLLKEDYIKRINQVFTFIEKNLDAELSLETIASIAHYSPFHFHRIFKTITKETLNGYVLRKRMEKSASVLMRKKEVTISELSLQYGFNSNSAFTRAFKQFYGISPTEFRKRSPDKYSKIRKEESKNGQRALMFEEYLCSITDLINWTNMHAHIEVKELPTMNLAYISHVGHDHLESTFERLLKWSGPRGLLDTPDVKMILIYHDSYKITPPDKVRMSACILLHKAIEVDGEIGLKTITKGKYITGRFEIISEEFEKAWTSMYVWLNEHGYKTTDSPSFEIHHNDFRKHPERKFVVDFCIPID
jgi:AraC family transcriptional regulator